MASVSQPQLSLEERDGIVLAVKSAFTKLKNLYQEITPVIQKYGFTVPSAGVIARDLSEKIEASIVQHCASFSKGEGHCDLSRSAQAWEVKICKDSGLTINQIARSVLGCSSFAAVLKRLDNIELLNSPAGANAGLGHERFPDR